MDYVSHGLWSYIFFNRIKKPALAVFFGLFPDNASWLIYLLYRTANGSEFGKPVIMDIPSWVFVLYDISHSLIICGFVLLVIFVIMRTIPVYVYAWPISIFFDLLTHRRDFLPTPFLWPLSDWKFPGISWGTRQFMIVNYSAITVCLVTILIKKRTKNK